MTAVDKRVVEMVFDNKQFEKGVQTSLGTIGDLKKGLNLDNVLKSFGNLANIGKTFTLEGIATSVDKISNKFSALSVVAVTALANIANSAVNTGKQMLSSLTVEPIMKGFSEYELKLGSIQTIMAGSGESLETVNKYLEELNTYSDKTIYSFADMTTNIGKFTNAGVSLKDSVAAIQGVANVAAISGANANEASRAMYNFGQALSSGSVKLIDWKSIELANMGTVEFKTQLLDTAVALKILTKTTNGYKTAEGTMVTATKGFNESLNDQWLTSKVLTTTLGKYADETTAIGKKAFAAAQDVKTFSMMMDTLKEAAGSGWAQSWEILIGDFEESKTLFTSINNVVSGIIKSSAKARNDILQSFKDLGGRTAVINSIKNVFGALLNIINPIKEAFSNLFPPITAQGLVNFAKSLENLTNKLKNSTASGDLLKRIFKGVAAIFDIISQAISSVIGAFSRLFESIKIPWDSILGFIASIGDYIVNLSNTIKINDTFNKTIEEIGIYIGKAIAKIKEFVAIAIPYFDKAFTDIQSLLQPVIKSLKEFGNSVVESFNKTGTQSVSTFGERVKEIFESIKKVLESAKNTFSSFGKELEKLSPVFAKIGAFFGNAFADIGPKIVDAVKNLDFNKVAEIIKLGLIGALGLSIKKFIDTGSKSIGGITEGATGVLDSVRGSLEQWQKNLKARTLIQIAIAIGILTLSIVALSMVDTAKLGVAIASISILFAELTITLNTFDKLKGDQISKSAIGLIALTVGLLILSLAVAKLSSIDQESLSRGLVGLGAILAEVGVFIKMADFSGLDAKKMAGLIVFAIALNLMAGAVSNFGKLKPQEMQQGLQGLAGMFAELIVFMQLTDKTNPVKAASSLVIMSVALLIMAGSLKALGNLSWEEMAKGLGVMAASLGIFTIAANAIKTNKLIKMAVSFTIISSALMVMAGALKALGNLSWEEIGKGLLSIVGVMAILVVSLNLMRGGLAGAAAILIIAVALGMLVPVLLALGNMPLAVIGIGLGALAAVFVVLGLATLILAPLVPVLFSLAAAMTLLAVAAYILGAAMVAGSVILATLAASGGAAAAVMTVIVTKILELLPALISAIVNSIVQFATQMASAAPQLIGAATSTFMAILKGIAATIPEFVAVIFDLVQSLLDELNKRMPDLVKSGMQLILSLLEGIAKDIEKVTKAAIDVMTGFLDGVSQKMPEIIQAGWDLVLSIISGLTASVKENMPKLLAEVGKLAAAIISGLAQGILDGGKAVVSAVLGLVEKALAVFGIYVELGSPSKLFERYGKWMVEGLVIGLNQNANSAEEATKNIGEKVASGLSTAMSTIADSINTELITDPVIKPVVDLSNVISGGKELENILPQNLNILGSINHLPNISNGASSFNGAEINPSNNQPIIFTQNNYSPAALSRIEIYRQTRNQLIAAKGLI